METTYYVKLVQPITQETINVSVKAKNEIGVVAALVMKMPNTKISVQHNGQRIIVDEYNYTNDCYTIKSISNMKLN